MSGVSVRPCGVHDVEAIAHVHRLSRAWYYGTAVDDDADGLVMWRQLLVEADRRTHVAVSEGAVVGFISTARRSTPPHLELSALYVLPARAGTGCGSRLYEAFEAERRRGEECRLEVWAANARAIAFYTNRGWVPTSTTRPGPGDVDYVTYELPNGHVA